MTYQVIARKWRPQTFEDVVGQPAITRTLQNAIADQRLHQAYIFSGPRGVGKTTTARLFARALNCLKGPTPEPCGQCPACQEISQGRSIDVLEIDAATHTQVDNVREVIISTIATTPARDHYRVFIIDEVHQLSNHAFNALLKTLEEPPPHALFIMATTERHKLPETILSRCQIFEFRLIAESKVFKRLRQIADVEQITIGDASLHKIARAGEGSMRDAQSVLDQVISFAGPEISDQDVVDALGIVETDLLIRLSQAIAEGDGKDVLRLVHELVEGGYDLRNFCRELMMHFRNLLVLKTVGYDSELLPLGGAELEQMRTLPERFSEGELIQAFHLLTEVEQNLKTASDPRFQLEMGLIKLAQIEPLRSISELAADLKALEKRLRGDAPDRSSSSAKSSSPAPGRTDASAPRSRQANQRKTDQSMKYQTESATPTSEMQAATGVALAPKVEPRPVVQQLKAVLDGRGKMLLLAALERARDIELVDDRLRVIFPQGAEVFKETVSGKQNVQLIENIAGQIAGHQVRLSVSIENDHPASNSREEKGPDQLPAGAENDPTVQSLLETFGGKLINVIPKA